MLRSMRRRHNTFFFQAKKKCEMAVRQRCRFAIKVFEGVQGEAFFRKFPLLFPA